MIRRIARARAQILPIAVWFGLLAGLLEGLGSSLLRLVPGQVIRSSPDILWLAPAVNLALFVGLGLGLSLLSAALNRPFSRSVVIGLFCAVGLFGLLLLIGRLEQLAALILSIGLAIQLARWLGSRERVKLDFQRRSLLKLGAVAAVTGVVGARWDWWREQAAVSALQPPPLTGPNVLLVVLDTLRADHVSAYGYHRPTTPNLDRFAEQGVLFERAVSNSSWTLPAHASLLTGRLPHQHGADWFKPLDGRFPVLAEVLASSGYLTAAFSANTEYATPEWGLGRGFARFEAYGSSATDNVVRTVYGRKLAVNLLPRLGYFDIPGRKRASEVNRELLSWLDGQQSGRPFFALLNYFDVHDPYITVEPYHSRYSPSASRGDLVNFQLQAGRFRRKDGLSLDEVQAEIDGYDGCLSYLDAQLGALFAELARRELADSTLVIVASDHGESLGEHDLFGHGNSLYLETLHVPLILSWPGRLPSGVRVETPVGLDRIPATVMDLLGRSDHSDFPGASLAGYWRDRISSQAEAVISEVSPGRFNVASYPSAAGALRSVTTGQWHGIFSSVGPPELYAWRQDVVEQTDLGSSSGGQAAIKELKEILRQRGIE